MAQSASPGLLCSVLHEASASIPINYLTLLLWSGESQAESFSKAQLIYWSFLCLECRLKQSVGSLVILLFSLWHILAFLSSPKSRGKVSFLFKKPPKTRKNQAKQAWCPGAACMHCHGCSSICAANVGSVRTHQPSDSTREAEESWVILLLAQY